MRGMTEKVMPESQSLSSFERWERQVNQDDEFPWYYRTSENGRLSVRAWERLPDHPEWAVMAWFEVDEQDEVILVDLSVHSAGLFPPKGGLTVDVWRSVRTLTLHTKVRGWLSMPLGVSPLPAMSRDKAGRLRRPGRRGRPDKDYAEIAAEYVEAMANSEAPVKHLAAKLNYGEQTIRALLHEARERDLLTDASKGKAGGQLTEKARRMLGMPERDS